MKIALIILAAGASRRFGPGDKLLALVDGKPLVIRTALEMAAVRVPRAAVATIAVIAGSIGPVATALMAMPLQVRPRLILNPAAAEGMGTSIAAGIASLSPSIDGALIVPADMPFLSADLVERLIGSFMAGNGQTPAHPVLEDGTSVGPVLWPRSMFARLMALTGETGGKSLLIGQTTFKIQLTAADQHVLTDIDTHEDLDRAMRTVGKPPRT